MSTADPRPAREHIPTGAPTTVSGRTYLPYLDIARLAAVLGVVAIHVLGGGVSSGQVGVPVVALDMALIAAVPIFFMMSGALTLDPRAHRRGPGEFLRRRAVRVLPALLAWSAFYIIVIRGMISDAWATPGGVLDMVVTGQTYTHLYFLFAIAGLYFITPVIQPFLAQHEGRRTWALGLLACAWTVGVMAIGQASKLGIGESHPVQAGTFTFFLVYLGYYVLGRAFLVRPIPRWTAVLGLMTVPGFIAAVTWLYLALQQTAEAGAAQLWISVLAPSYVSPVVVVYSIVLMASISSLCRDWRVSPRAEKVLRTLGNATFGVFLVHFAVLVVLRELVPALAAYTPGAMALVWAITSTISLGFALLGQKIPGLRLIV
jgi:surface polysaccharide O-acyltransferase-like enzyme